MDASKLLATCPPPSCFPVVLLCRIKAGRGESCPRHPPPPPKRLASEAGWEEQPLTKRSRQSSAELEEEVSDDDSSEKEEEEEQVPAQVSSATLEVTESSDIDCLFEEDLLPAETPAEQAEFREQPVADDDLFGEYIPSPPSPPSSLPPYGAFLSEEYSLMGYDMFGEECLPPLTSGPSSPSVGVSMPATPMTQTRAAPSQPERRIWLPQSWSSRPAPSTSPLAAPSIDFQTLHQPATTIPASIALKDLEVSVQPSEEQKDATEDAARVAKEARDLEIARQFAEDRAVQDAIRRQNEEWERQEAEKFTAAAPVETPRVETPSAASDALIARQMAAGTWSPLQAVETRKQKRRERRHRERELRESERQNGFVVGNQTREPTQNEKDAAFINGLGRNKAKLRKRMEVAQQKHDEEGPNEVIVIG
ncbi:hypothetical protein MBLNU459_g6788t1 [Dothideomycetes sp. NU459]